MLNQRDSGPRANGFTLVELLVVIAIMGVLVALLVPSLAKARRQALVLKCAANIRQVTYAMITYSYDNKGHFPESGGGQFPDDYVNRFSRAVDLRDDYLNGDSKVFHCPVAQPLYSTPTWKEATQTNFAAHGQIGYIYLGGWGSADTRSNWTYYGWYNQVASFNQGKRLTPTYSRLEADQAGNSNERPLLMDISLNSGQLYLGVGLSYRSYANPAHGQFLGSRNPADQNVGYVDGHGETHGEPFTNKPLRTTIKMHF
jgi:prepilin-type N-terminal cleavage/methylation domain-containing protein